MACGRIATVGYMQRDLVEKRGWLDRDDFLDGVALGQTMPGPLAAQVAMWVGYLVAGATVVLTRQAVVDYRTAAVAVVALALLFKFKLKEPYIVALGAVAGVVLH